jgi:multiple sugar transport system permease protein
MTGGGPQDATLTLPILVYNRAFVALQVGRASAITAVMFVLLALVTIPLLMIRARSERTT